MGNPEESRIQWFTGRLNYYTTSTWRRFQKLHVYGKAALLCLALFYALVIGAVIWITPARIAQYAYDRATELSKLRFGWMVIAGLTMLVSWPPLIGHTTSITLGGFAFGTQTGFLIGASASLIGSALVFVALRILFRNRLRSWALSNSKWQALESVIKEKGLPLIILIRVSPLPPWVYSNALFASIEAVSLWQFSTATLFMFPKLLLHAFIGAKLSALSDGDQRSHMDTETKIMNGVAIGGGLVVTIFTSGLIYRLVTRHIRHLEGLSPDTDELAAEAIEDFNEDEPLLRAFSPTNSHS